MKQLIQNYRTGSLELAEVPVPVCSDNMLLVNTRASFVSLGTERSIIELGRKSLLGKARARPDLAKRFLEKVKKEGFVKTFKEALDRLDSPTTIGYSSAGVVTEVGRHVHRFAAGDRVACIGAGYATHSEYITIPENLCCNIPGGMSYEEASSGMLGIIALHGIRCAKCEFGETVAVIGLGLLGQLTVQILQAYGCRVIGLDIDANKVGIAKQTGFSNAFTEEEGFRNSVEKLTHGSGADAVIITAATDSEKPVHTAVDIARFAGRIVVVGVADIHPIRNEMWHKEVEIVVSKAGGPGILDPFYENKGIDYPPGYVRWTENRNLEEYLRLVGENKVNVTGLISHRFPVEEAESVYSNLLSNTGGPYSGVVLEYPVPPSPESSASPPQQTIELVRHEEARRKKGDLNIGVIGAGLFGRSLLMPALKKIADFKLHTISTASSANTYHTAKKHGFRQCTTDYREVLKNEDIHAVVILAPHRLHCEMVTAALESGKHVFVEKPLCVDSDELDRIIQVYNSTRAIQDIVLQVGYNRRFSPHAVRAKDALAHREDPMAIHYRVNAGFVPRDHWVHSEEEGGSRVIGEICHFVDLMQFLTGCNPTRVFAERISGNDHTSINSDNVAVTLKFDDGSVGNIVYSGSGDRAFSRERMEVFCEGRILTIDDFRRSEYFRNGKKKVYKSLSQQMGYQEELQHFCDAAIHGKAQSPTPAESFLSTLSVFQINKALEKGRPCNIGI